MYSAGFELSTKCADRQGIIRADLLMLENTNNAYTVQVFNSYIICADRPGIVHDHRPDCRPVPVCGYIHSNAGHFYASLTFILICYQWTFVQPLAARRSVEWCRN